MDIEQSMEAYKTTLCQLQTILSAIPKSKAIGTDDFVQKHLRDIQKEEFTRETDIRNLLDHNKLMWFEIKRLQKEFQSMESFGDEIHFTDVLQLQLENDSRTETVNRRAQVMRTLKDKVEDISHVILHYQEKLRYTEEVMGKTLPKQKIN